MNTEISSDTYWFMYLCPIMVLLQDWTIFLSKYFKTSSKLIADSSDLQLHSHEMRRVSIIQSIAKSCFNLLQVTKLAIDCCHSEQKNEKIVEKLEHLWKDSSVNPRCVLVNFNFLQGCLFGNFAHFHYPLSFLHKHLLC